ncbi:MAG: sulfatase-like hydrolase/transferase [Phycisphaeraceae bacterium]
MNVLLILADDLRFDTIGARGRLPVQTPNLDQLMARGTMFTRAHLMGSSHGAVCMPSRAMLHTGRTLYHLEEAGGCIPPTHTMLGEHLRQAGYDTWGCGKWHSDKASFQRSFADGDEIFFGGMTDHWNVPAFRYDSSGAYDATLPQCPTPLGNNDVKWRPCDHIHAGRHSSEVFADASIRFLESRQASPTPWFMSVATLAPHDPRVMPERFRQLYDPNAIELPPNFLPMHPFDTGDLAGRDEKLAGFPRTEAEVRRHIAEYYGVISHLDHELGRIFDALEASGQDQNTLVIMTADHGLAVGQHGLMGKQNLYDHSVRVPLLMAGPGVPANQQVDELCYLIDVFPTICELLGLDVPATVQGESLAPCLNDPSTRVREVLHLAYRHLMRGVTDGKHKLIEYVMDDHRRTQLFDLEHDPWETTDRSSDPANAALLKRLRREMLRWRDEFNDNWPTQGGVFWQGYAPDEAPGIACHRQPAPAT